MRKKKKYSKNMRQIIEKSLIRLIFLERWLVLAAFSQVSTHVLEVTWFSCVSSVSVFVLDRTSKDIFHCEQQQYENSAELLSVKTETRSGKSLKWIKCLVQLGVCILYDATFTYLCATTILRLFVVSSF